MSEVSEQTDEQIAAEVLAGYEKSTRGDQPSVEVETQEGIDEPVIDEPHVVTLAEELQALKARIATSSGDSAEIRKLHGAVGDINRTLKALQAAPQGEADDELALALVSAEASAEEYPEVIGPLVKALKASIAQQRRPQDIEERVTSAVSRARETDAIEILKEDHPDFQTVRETPEYKSWITSKPPEFQEKFNNTWNPAVVARGLTEFKDSLKKRETRQNRLESAITPQGMPKQVKSSTLSDADALMVGYNSGPKRRIIQR